MSVVVILSVLAAFGILQAIFVACETALLMLTPGRVDRIVESSVSGSEKLETLVEQRHRMRGMVIFFNAFVAALCALAAAYIGTLGPDIWTATTGAYVALLALAGLLVFFVLFQALPRALAVTNPEFVVLKSAGLTLVFTRALGWLISLCSAPAKGLVEAAGGERKVTIWAVSPEWRDDDESTDESAEEQEALREAVSDFGDKIAREVMTPRTDMSALEDDATLIEAIGLISETGVSRIPIYHDNIDDIRGILYSKDLLMYMANEPDWQKLTKKNALLNIARPAAFVPETKPVLDLMVEMRTHTHLVIVTDEYGGTSGLVTLEDLLEEIVGDISDEFDPEEVLITPLGADRFVLDARTSVSDLNDLYDTDFDLDADSVGGLFSELVGHIPEVGESVETEGIKLIVTRVDGNRIVELRSYPVSHE